MGDEERPLSIESSEDESAGSILRFDRSTKGGVGSCCFLGLSFMPNKRILRRGLLSEVSLREKRRPCMVNVLSWFDQRFVEDNELYVRVTFKCTAQDFECYFANEM